MTQISFERIKFVSFLIILFGIVVFFTFGQELKHEVTVTLKLIQVYVMDSHDLPVTDLTAEDFVVIDNKKAVKITDFERYTLGPTLKGRPPLLPEEQKETAIESSAKTLNRKFFLFFDLANNSTQGFRKAQEAALHFVDTQLQSSDEVGILSFSVIKGLTLHEYLSTDRRVVRSAVEKLGKEGLVGRAENFEAELYRELTGESALDASQSSKPILKWVPEHSKTENLTKSGQDAFYNNTNASYFETRQKREEQKSITINLLDKLSGISKALRYIPGHKHILFFSSGIPYSLIFGDDRQIFPVDSLLRNHYEKMLQEFSNANTSVFSLNTEPLTTDVKVPSYYKGEKTLQKLAQYTGGKFLGNVQNYAESLDLVQTFTGSYYVLGYSVSEAWDGRYHQIRVEVNRPGCKVFAQKGYFNPKSFLKYSNLEKQIHLIDLALSVSPQFQVPDELSTIAVPCPYKNDAVVMLMAKAAGKPIEESVGKSAEIYFLVFDEDENLVTLKRKEIDQVALKNKEASYYSILPLSPGRYKCRVVVRDMGTGRGAVGRYAVEIPKYPDQGLLLFPPLLLNSGKSGLFVRGYTPKTENKNFPLVDFFPFDPGVYTPLLGDISGDSSIIQAVMHCLVKGLVNPQIRFTAQLVARESEATYPVPISVLSGKKEGDIGTIFVELKLPEIGPGDYTLAVMAEDTASGASSQTSIGCRIIDLVL